MEAWERLFVREFGDVGVLGGPADVDDSVTFLVFVPGPPLLDAQTWTDLLRFKRGKFACGRACRPNLVVPEA